MFFILFIVIALVAWALHLMQEAVQRREFSLMLAGFLVSSSAAALMAVYFLMGHYVGYMSEMSQRPYLYDQYEQTYLYDQGFSSVEWATYSEAWFDNATDYAARNCSPEVR